MPASIQTPIHICVTLQRVALSRYHSSSPLLRYLFSYTFAVIAFVRNNRFRVRQFGNQIRCYRTVIDLSTGDFKLGWQAITINYQVNLCGIACVAFSDRLCFLARCACTMLVRFNIAAINK
jgi:hypothetical protein